jgi:hypothetical protein
LPHFQLFEVEVAVDYLLTPIVEGKRREWIIGNIQFADSSLNDNRSQLSTFEHVVAQTYFL